MKERFDRIALACTAAAGSSWASLAAVALVLAWTVGGLIVGFTDIWMLIINTITTIVTFVLVFLIQSAQNRTQASQDRDTVAIQRKLDEVIRALPRADNGLVGIEKHEE